MVRILLKRENFVETRDHFQDHNGSLRVGKTWLKSGLCQNFVLDFKKKPKKKRNQKANKNKRTNKTRRTKPENRQNKMEKQDGKTNEKTREQTDEKTRRRR